MAEDMDSADTQVGDVDSSLNAFLPEPSKESSRETTPESVPTNDQSDRPKPKKRLTLQERLAQAAKGKRSLLQQPQPHCHVPLAMKIRNQI